MSELRTETQRLDFNALSRELVRHLRGKRSQATWSKRLGYGSNVVYLWETGRRFPSAGTLLRLAASQKRWRALGEFLRTPVEGRLFEHGTAGSEFDVGWLLRELAGDLATSTLSRRVGVDRSTLSRWLQGHTDPRLPEFLRFVEASSGRLLDFLSVFVNPKELDSIREAHDRLSAQRRIAYEYPWSHAVLHALSVHNNASQKRRIAQSVGLSLPEIERQLVALEAAGVISKRPNGTFEPTTVLTVDTSAEPELNYRLKQHWATVGLQRLERTRAQKSGLFSYNVFPIAQRDYLRLRELHLSYFEQVRKLIAGARGADRVVLVNVQLVPLDE